VKAQNILILTAVQMETRAMVRALSGRGCRFHTVGIGAKRLPGAVEVGGVLLILMCGLAGGLDPSLGVGDVILDDSGNQTPVLRCSQKAGSSAQNPAFLNTSETAPVRRGVIHTAAEIISDSSQKSELFARTGALAVDMEQSIIRDFARPLQIPVIGLRAISDAADQVLDPAIVDLVDDLGRPRPLKIASLLIHRPGMISYLRQLGANSNLAARKLGAAAVDLVDRLIASKGDHADSAKTSG